MARLIRRAVRTIERVKDLSGRSELEAELETLGTAGLPTGELEEENEMTASDFQEETEVRPVDAPAAQEDPAPVAGARVREHAPRPGAVVACGRCGAKVAPCGLKAHRRACERRCRETMTSAEPRTPDEVLGKLRVLLEQLSPGARRPALAWLGATLEEVPASG